jgi:hypothetical protein
MTIPINLQHELVEHLRKNRRTRKYQIPKIGVYHPTLLVQNCLRGQWNFFMISIQEQRLPDAFILQTSEGTVWHDMIEKLKVWDAVEQKVSMTIPVEGEGGKIKIVGTYDALRGDTIYDFKRTQRVPWGYRAKYPHRLQINFYMAALGKPKGVIAYIGYEGAEFKIKEYYHVLTDWMTDQLINKALTLHTHLVHNVPPVCSCRSKRHEIEWEQYAALKGVS